MTNYNRDQQIAGSHEAGIKSFKHRDDLDLEELNDDIDVNEVGMTENIDLSVDDDEAEEAFEDNERAKVRRAR